MYDVELGAGVYAELAVVATFVESSGLAETSFRYDAFAVVVVVVVADVAAAADSAALDFVDENGGLFDVA